ncbi:hypothetical protein ACFRJ9_19745 [Paenarthrobacter sp. NPDC056912]|uniref:hypothetical protein n=1 Tax=Paenarthrobacter sp. NPDC056912 TaxID=3345965 RepID=UPI00367162E0
MIQATGRANLDCHISLSDFELLGNRGDGNLPFDAVVFGHNDCFGHSLQEQTRQTTNSLPA